MNEETAPSNRRHRHDTGSQPHGPLAHEGITRGIQGLLGLCLVLTALLVLYTLAVA